MDPDAVAPAVEPVKAIQMRPSWTVAYCGVPLSESDAPSGSENGADGGVTTEIVEAWRLRTSMRTGRKVVSPSGMSLKSTICVTRSAVHAARRTAASASMRPDPYHSLVEGPRYPASVEMRPSTSRHRPAASVL